VDTGPIRQRVVAHVRHTTGQRGDADPMVPTGGTSQPNQQVFVVNPLKETAVYVARMPGGVRGGGREAPLYSIGVCICSWPVLQVW
jgi:hypothetical protein